MADATVDVAGHEGDDAVLVVAHDLALAPLPDVQINILNGNPRETIGFHGVLRRKSTCRSGVVGEPQVVARSVEGGLETNLDETGHDIPLRSSNKHALAWGEGVETEMADQERGAT